MVCIYCKAKTGVNNSRSTPRTLSTWRRRECHECYAIFTTREQPDLESTIRVKNTSGALSPFSRDKLFISLLPSVSHRKTALADAQSLTETIISVLIDVAQRGVITTREIIESSNRILKRFDAAAATHYHAHHQA